MSSSTAARPYVDRPTCALVQVFTRYTVPYLNTLPCFDITWDLIVILDCSLDTQNLDWEILLASDFPENEK